MTTEGPPPSPSDYDKQHWHEAERAHDAEHKHLELHTHQLEAFALLGLRTLGLSAAGGIAATLGFYSANYDRLSTVSGALGTVNAIVTWLFMSVLATLLSIFAAYFSQVSFASTVAARKRNYTFPYLENTPSSLRARGIGNVWRWASIGFAVAAGIMLITAGALFLTLAR